jgi:hypothetical protein
MTTIAIKDGVVAADSQTTAHNYIFRAVKMVRLPDGGVAVKCGDASAGYAGLKWLAEGERGDPPDITGATVVIYRPDYSIWVADDRWPAFPILDTEYGGGCGLDLVRLLLSQGRSAVEAVAEACEHDAMSSAPVLYMEVLPQREDPGVQMYVPAKPKRAPVRKPKVRK